MTVMVLESVSAFGLVGFSCEIGQQFTSKYDSIGVTLDKLRWYKLPMKMQRLLPVIILTAQQQLAIECFGSVLCLRTSFKSVSSVSHINSSFNIAFINNRLTVVCLTLCR